MQYQIFGLRLESEIPLPEASVCAREGPAEVRVERGTVDLTGYQDRLGQAWWQDVPSKDRVIFGCRGGIFDIRDGCRILVQASREAPPEMIRMFLLGSAMGAVQIQRGRIPLHGGAVVSKGQGVVITGHPGAGKSTMTAALVRSGFKFLSDDVSGIYLAEGKAMVAPAYPQMKLIRDACLGLSYDPAELPLVDAARDKFAIRDRARWQGEPAEARMLVRLVRGQPGDPLTARTVSGKAQVDMMLESLYRPWMHQEKGRLPPREMKRILSVAAKLRMMEVRVPRGADLQGIARELAASLDMQP